MLKRGRCCRWGGFGSIAGWAGCWLLRWLCCLQRESRWAPLMMVVAAALLAASLFQLQVGWAFSGTGGGGITGGGSSDLAVCVAGCAVWAFELFKWGDLAGACDGGLYRGGGCSFLLLGSCWWLGCCWRRVFLCLPGAGWRVMGGWFKSHGLGHGWGSRQFWRWWFACWR